MSGFSPCPLVSSPFPGPRTCGRSPAPPPHASTPCSSTPLLPLCKLAPSPPNPGGGQSGRLGGLHPWSRELASHPPVHSLVPGGALAPDGSTGLSPRSDDGLVPGRARSPLFRGTCKDAFTREGLRGDVPSHLWHQPWVTHCQPAGTGKAVLTSFAPSRRRLALTTHRIEQRADGYLTFRFQESPSTTWQRRTRPAHAFIRRFLPHGRPRGGLTVRSYGVLSPAGRPSLVPLRPLLATPSSCCLPAPHASPIRHPQQPSPPTPPARQCPTCRGPRVFLRHRSRPTRGPPCA